MEDIKKAEFVQMEIKEEENEKNKEITKDKLNKLLDINLNATVELGKTKISIEKALNLDVGSVVELDRIAGEPVDFYINENLFAKGEVVVIDDKYGIRILELVENNKLFDKEK